MASTLVDSGGGSAAVRGNGDAARPVPKVLLVDDQPARLLTYEAVLEGLGVHCTRALSGLGALERLLAEEFAVIVLDVNMPDMDGFEVARHVREHPRLENTPIIFVTGVNISDMDRLRGYEVGCIDYIPLPIVPEILRSKIALLVELYRRRTELKSLNQELETARVHLEVERNEALSHSRSIQRHNDEWFRTLLDHAIEHTILIEACRNAAGEIQYWRCLDANANALRVLNCSRIELVGARLEEVLKDRAEPLAALSAMVLQKRAPHHYEVAADGRVFRNVLFPVGENTVIASGLDITKSAAGGDGGHGEARGARRLDEWMNALVEGMKEEVYFTDAAKRYVYANPAALREFGHSTLEGRDLASVVQSLEVFRADGTPRPIEEAPPLRALSGATVRDEEQIVRHPGTGELRHRQVSAMPARTSSGEIVGSVSVVRDVTYRRLIEHDRTRREVRSTALLRLSDKIRTLGDPADIAYAAAEILGETLGVSRCGYGTIDAEAETITIDKDWNAPGIRSLAGVLHFREYGTYIEELKRGETVVCADAESDPRTAATAGALRGIQVQSFVNMPVIEAGGSVALLYLNHAQVRAWPDDELTFIRDIAERTRVAVERRRNEQALASDLECMGRLRDLSEHLVAEGDPRVLFEEILGMAMYIAQSTGGTIQLLDTASQELVLVAWRGFDPEHLRRFERVGPESGSSCGLALAAKQRVFIGYDPDDGADPDGSRAYLRSIGFRCAQSTPLVSRRGRMVGMFSTHWNAQRRLRERDHRFLDLLARQAADFIERQEVDRAMRESERLKDEFIAMLSHELRNPLVPIRNGITLLRNAPDPEGILAKIYPMMERQMSHTVRLIDDLLDASRITSGRIELVKAPVTLESVISAALDAHRDQIEALQVVLDLRIEDPERVMHVDSTRLAQAISNLLSNAVKFSAGRIDLVTSFVTVPETGTQHLVLAVRDNGVGIRSDELSRIFELFVSSPTRPVDRMQGSGLGVGLPLARRIVQLHGGTLEGFSDGPGLGSEFVLRIPVKMPEASNDTQLPFEAKAQAHVRVLVVDDNRDGADSMVLLLTSMGFDARAVYDGPAALDVAREFRPSIALLDIGMPGMDGYELCRRLRAQRGESIRIVALTGWGQDQHRNEALDAGFDAYLTKPVDADSFASTMAGVRPS
jgi:CheY-like chemotaxis protein